MIAESKALQEKMFLQPRGSPVLVAHHEKSSPEDARTVLSSMRTLILKEPTTIDLCPALQRRLPRLLKRGWKTGATKAHVVRPGDIMATIQAPQLTPTSSWNDIYLISPPITLIRARLRWKILRKSGNKHIGGLRYDGTNLLEDPTGWAFGKLVQAVLKDHTGVRGTWVSWEKFRNVRGGAGELGEGLGGGGVFGELYGWWGRGEGVEEGEANCLGGGWLVGCFGDVMGWWAAWCWRCDGRSA